MKKVELDFEDLASRALSSLTESNGGSLSTALWEMGIDIDSDEGKAIKEWFGWDDDEDDEPRDEEELKELFQDLAVQYDECDDIEDALDSLLDCDELTEEEYDIIQEHWDEWLPEEED